MCYSIIIHTLISDIQDYKKIISLIKLSIGGSAYGPFPNFGHMTIASGSLLKLAQVIMAEHKDKPVRINEVKI